MKQKPHLIACAGNEFGHVPGHNYTDIEIWHTPPSRRGARHQITICYVWGSAQGHDEEHGRDTWTERRDDPTLALYWAMLSCRHKLQTLGDAGAHLCEYLERAYRDAGEELAQRPKSLPRVRRVAS